MAIYIEVIECVSACIRLSSVDPDEAISEDELDNNAFIVPTARNDVSRQQADMNLIRNVLVAAGVDVVMR